MLGNFIYTKNKNFFLKQLEEGNILDEAVVFIEDTKQIWNHGTYFDCSVASEIFNNYKTEISNTYATKASLNNKVDKVSGKQLSSEDFTTSLKTRLEGINVHKHAFNALSALPDSGDGWYSIINLGDMESAIVQISAGQSDTQVAVSAGWGGNDIGSLVVLNCTLDVNNNYAHIKAVRIRRHKANNNDANGYLMLEAKLNRTGYTNGYRNTVVSVFTNAGHNPIVIDSNATNVLQLNSSTSETLLQEFELEDRTIMVKAINVETINADNLANVATTGNYNDLNNKPTIPAAQVNSDWNAASGKAQILNKPTIPTNLSDLSSDTTHRTVTDTEKQTWNNKSNFSGSYNDLTNKPSIPTKTSELENDSGFLAKDFAGYGVDNLTILNYLRNNAGEVLAWSWKDKYIRVSDASKDDEVLNIHANGDGTKFLSDNGAYKTIDLAGYAKTTDLNNKQDIIEDLNTIRSNAAKGATALQSYEEQYKGTVTGVTINGETKIPTNGVVNLGNVITEHLNLGEGLVLSEDGETILLDSVWLNNYILNLEKPTITFTINDVQYTVEEGITWGEAVYKYKEICELVYVTNSNTLMAVGSGFSLTLGDSPVYCCDLIQEDVYTISAGAGA